MRGQIRVEFVLAAVAFAVVSFAVATQINNTFSIVSSDSHVDVLRTKASGLVDMLVSDKQWLSDGQPFSINRTAIEVLNSTRDPLYHQCTRLEDMKLGGYIVTIANSTHTLLRCGAASVGTGSISISRVVWIERGYGTITVEMW